ncbi:hypothetical protein RAS2_22480 [Phycisphaerae bacterium RAS2]|nr:hypothetical protein RAS2_22480 [Phycisphaerae bacterium RAS2]
MMHASLLFWIALALPGFAVVRRWDSESLRSGLLGTLGLSYLATFAVLTAVVIPLYVIRAPLGVFSGAIVVLVAASIVDLTRRGGWKDGWRLMKEARGVPLVLVLVALAIDVRNGGFLGGDAVIHLSRIRHLIDHGLSNRDPFVAGDYFFPVYHTNIVHALYASASQLTGVPHLEVWAASCAWAKLLIITGVYYLAWVVFSDQVCAWLAALFCIVARGPVTFSMYPNQLAPYWLLPMAIALAIRATGPIVRSRDAVGLGATVLVIGSMHGLYAAFAVMAAGPILAYSLVRHIWRRTGRAVPTAAYLLALAVGLPFGLISKLKTATVQEKIKVYDITPEPSGDYVQTAGDGWVRRIESLPAFLGGSNRGSAVLVAAIGLSFLTGWAVAARVLFVLSVPVIATVMLFVPPLCTLLMRVFGEEWVVSRYEIVTSLAFYVLVPGGAALVLLRWQRGALIRAGLCAATLAGAWCHTNYEEPWTWRDALRLAMRPTAEREHTLRELMQIGELVRRNVPRGAVVLSEPMACLWFTMSADCRIIASPSASNGVPELDRRLKDLYDMLQPGTDWQRRRDMLIRYNVQYFVPTTGVNADWVRPHIAAITQTGELTFIRLKL